MESHALLNVENCVASLLLYRFVKDVKDSMAPIHVNHWHLNLRMGLFC